MGTSAGRSAQPLNERVQAPLANRRLVAVVDHRTELHPVNRFKRFKFPVTDLAFHPLRIVERLKKISALPVTILSQANCRRFNRALSSDPSRGALGDVEDVRVT